MTFDVKPAGGMAPMVTEPPDIQSVGVIGVGGIEIHGSRGPVAVVAILEVNRKSAPVIIGVEFP